MAEFERAFDWNDTIENDSTFTLLPAGTYPFTIKSFERGMHQPGPNSKLPVCPKAVLTIEIEGGPALGTATVTHNLFLHSRCEGLLCEFFTAIGQRKRGEPLKMDWNAVPGARGTCEVSVRKWTGRDGQQMESNDIKRFVEPSKTPSGSAATVAAPSGYTAGKF